jgi:hypothetical protein
VVHYWLTPTENKVKVKIIHWFLDKECCVSGDTQTNK